MKKPLLLVFLLTGILFGGTNVNAQVLTGCAGAVDLNITPNFNSSVPTAYDPSIDYGCVSTSSQYFVYGYFKACTTGSLTLHASANTSGVDADIVVWGPFSSTNNICANLTSGNIAGCANTTNPQDTVSLGTVNAGDIYMVSIGMDTSSAIAQLFFTGTASVNSSCSGNNCLPVSGMEYFCLATVDSATQKYKLTWEKLPGNPVSYFEIYKYGLNQQFNLIDTVNYSSLSEYIDMNSSPASVGAKYQLVVRDTCGGGWVNTAAWIQPVFCQASVSSSNTVNVNWTPYYDYNITPVYYVIYRGATPTSMIALDSVPDFVNAYTDLNPLPGISYYKIGVGLNSTCVPSRMPGAVVQSYSNNAWVTVVGLNELSSLPGISFYPNPATDQLTIKGVESSTDLTVTDMAGRTVYAAHLSAAPSQQISLSMLEKGMYQLRFSSEKGTAVQQLLIAE